MRNPLIFISLVGLAFGIVLTVSFRSENKAGQKVYFINESVDHITGNDLIIDFERNDTIFLTSNRRGHIIQYNVIYVVGTDTFAQDNLLPEEYEELIHELKEGKQ